MSFDRTLVISAALSVAFESLAGASFAQSTELTPQSPSRYERARHEVLTHADAAFASVSRETDNLLRFDLLTVERRRESGVDYVVIGFRSLDVADVQAREADSRGCTGIKRAIEGLAWLSPPRMLLADLEAPPDPIYLSGPGDASVTDGAAFRVRTAARYEDLENGQLEFSATAGTSVSRWFESTLSDLENCWQPVHSSTAR